MPPRFLHTALSRATHIARYKLRHVHSWSRIRVGQPIPKIKRPDAHLKESRMNLSTMSEHRLVLTDYDEIIEASNTFTAQPQLANTTQTIVIEENHEDVDDARRDNKFRAITSILTECSKHRVLEAFKWRTSSDDSATRPGEFWEALAKVAPKLQHLSFDFHTHELHRMKETGISAKFPSTFPLLKSLYVDCAGAHGDDGTPIENLLHGLPNLQLLHIDAPICDLEGCRLQGLTWAYKFPRLSHLALSIFYRSAEDIASFLANHPNIRSLMFDVEGEEPIPHIASLLPDLEALSLEGWGQTTSPKYTELLGADPPRKITYFKTGQFPYDQYRLIPQYAPSLQCLELSLYIEDIRNENAQYRTTKALLALLPDISELAIHFSSGWTTMYEADGTSRQPLPMDEELLSKIVKALPPSSNLQVLRMKDKDDGKGSPLAVQSSTFASLRESLPPNLKTLQWEIDNSTVRYELEVEGSIRIVDLSHRQWPDALLWTDESILRHIQS